MADLFLAIHHMVCQVDKGSYHVGPSSPHGFVLHITSFLSSLMGPRNKGMVFLLGNLFLLLTRGTSVQYDDITYPFSDPGGPPAPQQPLVWVCGTRTELWVF